MQIQSLKAIGTGLHNITHNLNRFDLRYTFDSPNVDYTGHDEGNQLLFVQFKDGKSYLYFDVPVEVWKEWNSTSPGNFLASRIKGHYRYERQESYYAEPADSKDVAEAFKQLLHHRDSTKGLYATDKPEMVVDDKGFLFKID